MAFVLLLAGLVMAEELSHVYEANDTVTIWFNKWRPRQELNNNHSFNWLPIFHGQSSIGTDSRPLSFGEAIEGIKMQDSGMDVGFLQEVKWKFL